MKNKNICKFIPDVSLDQLKTHCFIYETNPDVMKSPFVLPHHRAILVTQGTGSFKFGESLTEFAPGNLVFGFENETFSTICDNSCEYMYIDFSGTRADTLFRRFGINEKTRIFTGFDGMLPLWREGLSRASQVNIDLTSEGILLYTLSRLTGISVNQNHLINKIIEITEGDFNNPSLSLSAIAETLAYNPKYISHIFKQKMGISYSEYLNTQRIKYAVLLIEHGIESVKNIAFLSGFSDPLYFSTVFKKFIGVSPKEYKNSVIKKDENTEDDLQ